MKICRIRNFKKSAEVTFSFTGKEAEYLSHAIDSLGKWARTPSLTEGLGYPGHTQEGAKLLTLLNDEVFWTHWESNFGEQGFEPKGQMIKTWDETPTKHGQE